MDKQLRTLFDTIAKTQDKKSLLTDQELVGHIQTRFNEDAILQQFSDAVLESANTIEDIRSLVQSKPWQAVGLLLFGATFSSRQLPVLLAPETGWPIQLVSNDAEVQIGAGAAPAADPKYAINISDMSYKTLWDYVYSGLKSTQSFHTNAIGPLTVGLRAAATLVDVIETDLFTKTWDSGNSIAKSKVKEDIQSSSYSTLFTVGAEALLETSELTDSNSQDVTVCTKTTIPMVLATIMELDLRATYECEAEILDFVEMKESEGEDKIASISYTISALTAADGTTLAEGTPKNCQGMYLCNGVAFVEEEGNKKCYRFNLTHEFKLHLKGAGTDLDNLHLPSNAQTIKPVCSANNAGSVAVWLNRPDVLTYIFIEDGTVYAAQLVIPVNDDGTLRELDTKAAGEKFKIAYAPKLGQVADAVVEAKAISRSDADARSTLTPLDVGYQKPLKTLMKSLGVTVLFSAASIVSEYKEFIKEGNAWTGGTELSMKSAKLQWAVDTQLYDFNPGCLTKPFGDATTDETTELVKKLVTGHQDASSKSVEARSGPAIGIIKFLFRRASVGLSVAAVAGASGGAAAAGPTPIDDPVAILRTITVGTSDAQAMYEKNEAERCRELITGIRKLVATERGSRSASRGGQDVPDVAEQVVNSFIACSILNGETVAGAVSNTTDPDAIATAFSTAYESSLASGEESEEEGDPGDVIGATPAEPEGGAAGSKEEDDGDPPGGENEPSAETPEVGQEGDPGGEGSPSAKKGGSGEDKSEGDAGPTKEKLIEPSADPSKGVIGDVSGAHRSVFQYKSAQEALEYFESLQKSDTESPDFVDKTYSAASALKAGPLPTYKDFKYTRPIESPDQTNPHSFKDGVPTKNIQRVEADEGVEDAFNGGEEQSGTPNVFDFALLIATITANKDNGSDIYTSCMNTAFGNKNNPALYEGASKAVLASSETFADLNEHRKYIERYEKYEPSIEDTDLWQPGVNFSSFDKLPAAIETIKKACVEKGKKRLNSLTELWRLNYVLGYDTENLDAITSVAVDDLNKFNETKALKIINHVLFSGNASTLLAVYVSAKLDDKLYKDMLILEAQKSTFDAVCEYLQTVKTSYDTFSQQDANSNKANAPFDEKHLAAESASTALTAAHDAASAYVAAMKLDERGCFLLPNVQQMLSTHAGQLQAEIAGIISTKTKEYEPIHTEYRRIQGEIDAVKEVVKTAEDTISPPGAFELVPAEKINGDWSRLDGCITEYEKRIEGYGELLQSLEAAKGTLGPFKNDINISQTIDQIEQLQRDINDGMNRYTDAFVKEILSGPKPDVAAIEQSNYDAIVSAIDGVSTQENLQSFLAAIDPSKAPGAAADTDTSTFRNALNSLSDEINAQNTANEKIRAFAAKYTLKGTVAVSIDDFATAAQKQNQAYNDAKSNFGELASKLEVKRLAIEAAAIAMVGKDDQQKRFKLLIENRALAGDQIQYQLTDEDVGWQSGSILFSYNAFIDRSTKKFIQVAGEPVTNPIKADDTELKEAKQLYEDKPAQLSAKYVAAKTGAIETLERMKKAGYAFLETKDDFDLFNIEKYTDGSTSESPTIKALYENLRESIANLKNDHLNTIKDKYGVAGDWSVPQILFYNVFFDRTLDAAEAAIVTKIRQSGIAYNAEVATFASLKTELAKPETKNLLLTVTKVGRFQTENSIYNTDTGKFGLNPVTGTNTTSNVLDDPDRGTDYFNDYIVTPMSNLQAKAGYNDVLALFTGNLADEPSTSAADKLNYVECVQAHASGILKYSLAVVDAFTLILKTVPTDPPTSVITLIDALKITRETDASGKTTLDFDTTRWIPNGAQGLVTALYENPGQTYLELAQSLFDDNGADAFIPDADKGTTNFSDNVFYLFDALTNSIQATLIGLETVYNQKETGVPGTTLFDRLQVGWKPSSYTGADHTLLQQAYTELEAVKTNVVAEDKAMRNKFASDDITAADNAVKSFGNSVNVRKLLYDDNRVFALNKSIAAAVDTATAKEATATTKAAEASSRIKNASKKTAFDTAAAIALGRIPAAIQAIKDYNPSLTTIETPATTAGELKALTDAVDAQIAVITDAIKQYSKNVSDLFGLALQAPHVFYNHRDPTMRASSVLMLMYRPGSIRVRDIQVAAANASPTWTLPSSENFTDVLAEIDSSTHIPDSVKALFPATLKADVYQEIRDNWGPQALNALKRV